MSFKPLYTNVAGSQGDINVSASLVAEAGMVGNVLPNGVTGDPEVVLADDSSTGILGIIDDNKTTTFSATIVDEIVASGQTVLSHANVIAASDTSHLATSVGTVVLTSRANGTITVTGVDPNTPALVSYSYVIPGKAGDDSTLASGKCTICLQEGEYSTDVYELHGQGGGTVKAEDYVVGAALKVASTLHGQQGRLSVRSGLSGPIVGYVTKQPTAGNPFMNFFFKPTA